MVRLFVGLTIPEDVRGRLASLLSGLPGARWLAPENMHVTVRFIGPVDEAVGEHLAVALDGISAPAFEIAFAGLGVFKRRRRPTALWTGVAAEPCLGHLHGKMESALVRAGGLEPEGRKFSPHATLARFQTQFGNSSKTKATSMGRVAEWLESHGDFRTRPFAVDRFVLLRSRLGSGGAHYEEVAAYPLNCQKPNLESVLSTEWT